MTTQRDAEMIAALAARLERAEGLVAALESAASYARHGAGCRDGRCWCGLTAALAAVDAARRAPLPFDPMPTLTQEISQ